MKIAVAAALCLSSYKIIPCLCFTGLTTHNTRRVSFLNSVQEEEETNPAQSSPDTIISPFKEQTDSSPSTEKISSSLEFTLENIDHALEEVRPYLISDGGNVSLERIDVETKDVYLVLEGACGSCPSSTVTMQMGIERVLRENFPDLGQVLQVTNTPPEDELSVELVQFEVDRLLPAITAMGGVVKVVSVDKETGMVQVFFKGPNRIRQGLEMAITDIPVVEDVQFLAQ